MDLSRAIVTGLRTVAWSIAGLLVACLTALVRHLDDVRDKPIRCSIDLLLNGYIPRLAYERGDMPTDAPLEVVMQRYAISAKAQAAGVGPDFSQRIREGLGRVVNAPDDPDRGSTPASP